MSDKALNTTMPYGEFVTLMALMMSLVALSIDAMLPALPQIGHDLHVLQANDNQLIISLLFLGFALGQVIYGPLSDSFGRKPAVYAGFLLVIIGCLMSIFCETMTGMLAARFIQGLGLAAPRVVSIALIRDQYEGNDMARVMSFIMMVFILVPAIAPALGQGILFFFDWRMIFSFILILTCITWLWFFIRQQETLPIQKRTPFSVNNIYQNILSVCSNRIVIAYTIMTGFVFSSFLGYLSSAQQIFQIQYDLAEMFPLYFAVLALSIGCASFTNGKLVMRFGMHHMARYALIIISAVSTLFFVVASIFSGQPALWMLMMYLMVVLFCFGILMGNLNALAMQPLGHMAGIGASVVGTLSTLISVPFGVLIGQSYNHTILPLIAGFAVFSILALLVMRWVSVKELNIKNAACG